MAEPSKTKIRQRLEQMDPYQLEKLVAEIWKKQGYQTNVSASSVDRGIDIEAIKKKPFKQKVLIQVKRYTKNNKIGSEEIRKYSTLEKQEPNTDMIVLVTTSDFTNPGKKLAADLNVKIIGGDKLAQLVYEYIDKMEDTFPELYKKSERETSNGRVSDTEQIEIHPFDMMTPDMVEPTKQHEYFQTCSVCKNAGTIWYTKGNRIGEVLKCSSCETTWSRTGLIFKDWEILKERNK